VACPHAQETDINDNQPDPALPDASWWPPELPRHLTIPQTSVYCNLEVSAARFPDKPCTIFYGGHLTYRELWRQTEHLAGFLQNDCGVAAGDRVAVYMQNSPQWVMAFYAILRCGAVVVPVNPMNRTDELRHVLQDSGASILLAAQDLLAFASPLLGDNRESVLQHIVVATYSDYIDPDTDLRMPAAVSEPRLTDAGPRAARWHDVMALARVPGALVADVDDLCVMPYTSGTTGRPKGCAHSHRSVMTTLVGGVQWFARTQDAVYLSALPFFHVTGLTGSMNGPLFAGATMVILARWDREVAALYMERYRVTVWQAITTMLIDFLAHPGLHAVDLRSLGVVRGGGAAMPEAVAAKLKARTGLDYVEGYGLSETMAAVMINPPRRPKPQCLGVPLFDVEACIVEPGTLRALPAGEVGELLVHAPQVMREYWRNEQATREALVAIDGKTFLRTGDLARVDDDGYYFMVDRLKRMVNVSGYKVWPAEVETMMYAHPEVQEVCVVGATDAEHGELVKAYVVLKTERDKTPTAQDVVAWTRDHMAAYKCPRVVEFVSGLPKSSSGKVMWRELQAGTVVPDR
jgi:fatty-acyl-CoA synthase